MNDFMDPDPQRQHLACGDCSSPALALTSAPEVGDVLAVQHDPTCPTYHAMSEDQRTEITDSGAVVHLIQEPETVTQQRKDHR